MASFWKPEACGQTVLPDRSVLIGQNWWKIPKYQNSNATFWVIFKQCERGWNKDKRQKFEVGQNGMSRVVKEPSKEPGF